MNPLVLVAAVGVGLWIWGRYKAAMKPPAVVADTTGGSSQNAKPMTDAINATDSNTVGVLSTMAAGAAAGAVLGPIGAAFGAVLGLFLGILFSTDVDPLTLPWHTWGMPYYSDACTVEIDPDGVERLHVPIVAAQGPLPSEVRISTDTLRQLYPGPGAYEACLSSGMFAWRPREVATPFSLLLYAACPWLLPYEDQFFKELLGVGNADKQMLGSWGQGGISLKVGWGWFWSLSDEPMNTTGLLERRSIMIMRRLWAAVAYYGLDWMLRDFAENRFDTDTTEVLEPYMKQSMAPLVASPVHGTVTADQSTDTKSLPAPSFGLADVSSKIGNSVTLWKELTACGFPGAWCFTNDPPTLNTLHDTPNLESDPVLAPTRQTGNVARNSAMASGNRFRIQVQRPEPSDNPIGKTTLRISVWFPSWTWDTDTLPFERRDGGCWGHREVVPLQLFLDSGLYASEADIMAELSAGTLVWGPNWTQRAHDVWVRIEPNLASPSVDLRRRRIRLPNIDAKIEVPQ